MYVVKLVCYTDLTQNEPCSTHQCERQSQESSLCWSARWVVMSLVFQQPEQHHLVSEYQWLLTRAVKSNITGNSVAISSFHIKISSVQSLTHLWLVTASVYKKHGQCTFVELWDAKWSSFVTCLHDTVDHIMASSTADHDQRRHLATIADHAMSVWNASVNGCSVARWWGVQLALITFYCTLLLFPLTHSLSLSAVRGNLSVGLQQ